MPIAFNRLTVALLLAGATPLAHAEIAIDVIGGSEIGFEGLLQADYNHFGSDLANLNGDALDGRNADQELRRAELVLKGKGPGNIDWVVGYDAKADKWLDVNAKYKLGGNKQHYIQLGQFKQPNSLEELSSTKNNDFISKATITNSFATGRRLGAAYSYGSGPFSLTASAFGRELTRNKAAGAGYGLRGTFAPINRDGTILHFGLSYVDREIDGDAIKLSAKPNADLTRTSLVSTGTLANADRMATIGLESFWTRGPVKLQGEYMQVDVNRYGASTGDFSGSGGYLSALWNVTGEGWKYRDGVPGTSGPSDPAAGMWQLGLRYDTIDLDDGAVQGGQMDAITAGVNYYWRSNFKFALNYVKVDSHRAGIDDNPDITEARVQFFW
ncbi:MAG: OprO/OprP family phosphate-selective porin [Lysobacter sp.]